MASAPYRPSRRLRVAGYLAILFGLFGAMSGVIASSTFFYFENQSDYSAANAGILTAIAAVGAFVSAVLVISGWGLIRSRHWAWKWTLSAVVASVLSVVALIVFWPPRWGFLVVVAIAFALEGGLLILGRGAPDPRKPRGLPG